MNQLNPIANELQNSPEANVPSENQEARHLHSFIVEELGRDATMLHKAAGKHMLTQEEVTARSEARTGSLQAISAQVDLFMQDESFDREALDQIQALEDNARESWKHIEDYNAQLYSPDSVETLGSLIVQSKARIEDAIGSKVSDGTIDNNDVPGAAVDAIDRLRDVKPIVEELADELGYFVVKEADVDEGFSRLRKHIAELPTIYDNAAMSALLKLLGDIIQTVDDADHKRAKIGTLSAELRELADRIGSSAESIA